LRFLQTDFSELHVCFYTTPKPKPEVSIVSTNADVTLHSHCRSDQQIDQVDYPDLSNSPTKLDQLLDPCTRLVTDHYSTSTRSHTLTGPCENKTIINKKPSSC